MYLSEEWIELEEELEAGRGDHLLLQLSAVEGGERADAAVRRHVGRRHEVGDVAVVEVRGEEVLRCRLVLPRGQVGKAVRAVQPCQNSDVALLTLDASTCSEKGV